MLFNMPREFRGILGEEGSMNKTKRVSVVLMLVTALAFAFGYLVGDRPSGEGAAMAAASSAKVSPVKARGGRGAPR